VPGYPVTPILFVGAAGLLVLDTLLTQPGRAALGLGAVLIGTPAFYVWRHRTAPLHTGEPSFTEQDDVTATS
jgi:APA family basic amino acid/polyamine antiporter